MVSLASRQLPAKRYNYYYLLVDNGMFRFYNSTGRRPELGYWFAELKRFLWDLERLRRPREIIVVLPDWLYDYPFTYGAARSVYARELCSIYKCLVVAHPGLGGILAGYADYAEKYASIDWVWGLAAPLKINCSRFSAKAKRRIINLGCQQAITEQVCGVARKHGMHCHGLGVALKPRHVKRLVELGLGSFDSSSWTRPINKPAAKTAGWSAKTRIEREQYFMLAVQRLAGAGIPLEGAESIPVTGGNRAT